MDFKVTECLSYKKTVRTHFSRVLSKCIKYLNTKITDKTLISHFTV